MEKMGAIEEIYERFVGSDRDVDPPEIAKLTNDILEEIENLLPLEASDRIFWQILDLAVQSQKHGFVEGFKTARMARSCG